MSKVKYDLKVLYFFLVKKNYFNFKSKDFYGLRGGYGLMSYMMILKDNDKFMFFVIICFILKFKSIGKIRNFYKIKCYK